MEVTVSDRISLERRHAPWSPPDSEIVKILNYYDMPWTGIIRQHGVPFLFHCFFGQMERVQLWRYVSLTPDEAERLESLDGDDLQRELATLEKLPGVVGVAEEEDGLLVWEETGDSL